MPSANFTTKAIFFTDDADTYADRYFTQPFKISYKGDTSALQRFFSSYPTETLLGINRAFVLKEYVGEKEAVEWLDKYLVQSLFNHCCYLVVSSIIYRTCQLVSLEARHRIAQSNLPPAAKFICTGLAISFPVLIVYLTGGAYGSILVSSAIDLTVSHALPAIYANFFKRIDLISTTRSWKPANFIFQNVKLLVRYVAIDFLVLNKLLEPILNIQNPAHYLIKDKLYGYLAHSLKYHLLHRSNLYDSVRIFTEMSIHLKREGNAVNLLYNLAGSRFIILAHSQLATPLSCFFIACAWLLGRIIIDGTAILLHRKNIVKDLRSPISSIFSSGSIPKIQQFLNNRANPLPPNTSNTVATDEFKAKLRQQYFEQNLPTEDSASTSYSQTRKKPSKPKTNTPPVAATSEAKESVAVKTDREPIQIPGYTHTIVPLNTQGAESNMWGLITYDLHDRDTQSLGPYLTALNSRHIGNQTSSIKWLGAGKGKFEGKTVYEIRPKSLGDRLLGYAVKEEEAIDNALQQYLPYEVALPFFEQMQYQDKPVSLVIFCEKVKHADLRKYLK